MLCPSLARRCASCQVLWQDSLSQGISKVHMLRTTNVFAKCALVRHQHFFHFPQSAIRHKYAASVCSWTFRMHFSMSLGMPRFSAASPRVRDHLDGFLRPWSPNGVGGLGLPQKEAHKGSVALFKAPPTFGKQERHASEGGVRAPTINWCQPVYGVKGCIRAHVSTSTCSCST